MGGSWRGSKDLGGKNAHGTSYPSVILRSGVEALLRSTAVDVSVSDGERINLIFAEMQALDNQRRYLDRASERLNAQLVEILDQAAV